MADEIALAAVRSVASNLTLQTNVNVAAIDIKVRDLGFPAIAFSLSLLPQYGALFSTVK
jgi:hypothetical protein